MVFLITSAVSMSKLKFVVIVLNLAKSKVQLTQIDNISAVAVVTQSDENNADLMIAAYVVSDDVVDFDTIKTKLGNNYLTI